MKHIWWISVILLVAVTSAFVIIHRSKPQAPDYVVKLPSGQTEVFSSFFSEALGETMHYSILLPFGYGQRPDLRYPVLYLLHGGGDDYKSWLTKSSLVDAVRDYRFIVVMPEGRLDYYINSALPPKRRFEDYIVIDLIKEIDGRFRTVPSRSGRAIGGNSMGGFAAVRFAFAHPDSYSFVVGLSSALDVPNRRFSWRRYGQSFRLTRIFGLPGSVSRQDADPFAMLKKVKAPQTLPYIYLACGKQDPLLAVNVHFWNDLTDAGVAHTQQVTSGGHGWDAWNAALPAFVASMVSRNDWQETTLQTVH